VSPTPRRKALDLAAAAACLSAPASIAANAPSPVRLATVLALFCLAPGAAALAVMGPRNRGADIGLVIGLSLGIVILCAQSMLWLGTWQPELFAYALAGACALALGIALSVQRQRQQADDGHIEVPGTHRD